MGRDHQQAGDQHGHHQQAERSPQGAWTHGKGFQVGEI
jgi:hypothetical protein